MQYCNTFNQRLIQIHIKEHIRVISAAVCYMTQTNATSCTAGQHTKKLFYDTPLWCCAWMIKTLKNAVWPWFFHRRYVMAYIHGWLQIHPWVRKHLKWFWWIDNTVCLYLSLIVNIYLNLDRRYYRCTLSLYLWLLLITITAYGICICNDVPVWNFK